MQIKDSAASIVLGLLFISLLAIYLVTDQNPLVTGLSIIIIAICLIIVRVGDWREIGIIGVVATIVSIVAAYLVGDDRFGNIGAVLVPTLWTLLLIGVFAWLAPNARQAPEDRVLLAERTFSGEIINQPFAKPLPVIERTLATIPLYPLSTDVVVKDLNTKAKANISEVHVHVEYRISNRNDATKAMSGIPNRSLIQSRVAKELNKSVEEARTDVRFWEELLEDLIQAETDDVARLVIRNYERPYAAYTAQDTVNENMLRQLDDRVKVWGVQLNRLVIDKMVLPEAAWPPKRNEEEAEKFRQQMDAERIRNLQSAQAEAEAERVRRLIEAVREAGIDTIPPGLLEDIIVSATSDPSDRVLDMEISRWFNDNFKTGNKK